MNYQNKLHCIMSLCLAGFTSIAFAQKIELKSNWTYREEKTQKWYTASVPGEIHTDLLNSKLIPDPFYRDNEKKLQWIERKNWEYKTAFQVTANMLKKKNTELVFDGLDTYAAVYVNNQLVLKADNMFRQWRVDVKKVLKSGNNDLRIVFQSAQNVVDSLAKKDYPFVIPDNPRTYVRKAQYHFGWDWGPKFTTCGIWKTPRFEAYDEKEPEKPYVLTRKIELIQDKDSLGSSFYFKIDGNPVYMKGANYIPSDAFLSRVSKKEYEKIVLSAKEANMNMLRVWGGGIYEDDYFYDLCDKYGINVWQDFMFAGTMVPGDDAFFENVKKEVQYQVKRLRHHPSIVLWCGNNESDEAFKNWGWMKNFKISKQDSIRLWKDYTRLFHDSIPKWVKEVDGKRPYLSSSPLYHWSKPKSVTEGDSHYWGIWWGLEDIEAVQKKTGRFVSEYGMLSMPNYSSVEVFTLPEDRYLYSDIVLAHQKSGKGFEKLDSYLNRYFIDSAKIKNISLEDYTYLTQCLQYYVVKNIAGTHRSKEPYNMGTLIWQLNDCWPTASWSITDYYNREPRASWYAIREAYRDDVKPETDFIRPRDLSLEDPKINWEIKGNNIIIKALKMAKYVYISMKGYNGKWSDNYFDLKAGEEKTISFEGKITKPEIKIYSLFEVLEKYK
ncbi:beta-mannosidase [Flavobacterium johnsoniae]|uniref:Beta-mannosidase n=1 Tax=Flavobacterium johnsoniae (strain ATCC 17061 / DSM 2064 / JCM 8514 / BCRC 14874 / CCUG 350202 / NBRC 14942 / NCIMB 11054 / UW101) TaxID=376686 RepID=A5FGD2_FLAJ1|nr:glycoside hydrolase family 2 protein [Flavobacterium johnsoniae]ABQ05735.1 Candidate beta-mannosidase; Glycoside hydrolase family 2 [Flavobacterium johnsoniae UW101]WQG81472.1 glycoside hydrolase family 2 protein [Flavobacterium johnsoniae UW101]